MNAPTQIRIRVAAPRGTRVFVEVVEFDAGDPALPPPTFDTTAEPLPSEPPASSNVRTLRPRATEAA